MSLWNVDDRMTAILMEAFVRELRDHAPAVALRLAGLDFKRTRAEPAHWTAFTLLGTPR